MSQRTADSGMFHVALRQLPKLVGILAFTLRAIAAKPAPDQSGPPVKERYLSPIEMAFSPDGHLLYVVCQDSDEVRVLDPESEKVLSSIHVGRVPRGIALAPDARRIYVANAWSDTVSVIDAQSRE